MISRMWRATATDAGATRYAQHFRGHVLPTLARVDGYHGAMLLQRASGAGVELLVVSFWRSEEVIRAFAGPDITRAVVADDARDVLESFEDTVSHFAVIDHDAWQMN
jgi:heme-degrading monooxygenase HmoA